MQVRHRWWAAGRWGLGWSVGAVAAALPLVAAVRDQRHAAFWLALVRLSRPQGWFRGLAWFWTVVTIVSFPLYYIGLVFLPLVIGCRRAARTGRSDRTSSARRPG